MDYKEAKKRFKSFGSFCDDRHDACDDNCKKCSRMEDRILEAMNRQIPKKPSMFDERGNVTATDRCCKCHKVIYNKYSYCPYCGQAIDWEV